MPANTKQPAFGVRQAALRGKYKRIPGTLWTERDAGERDGGGRKGGRKGGKWGERRERDNFPITSTSTE